MGTVYNLDIFRRTGNRGASIITNSSLLSEVSYRPVIKNLDEFGFDSSIYEDIRNRYGNSPPPKGVIYSNPVQGMKIDAYGYGNVHNSVFQYKPKRLNNYNWNRPMPFPSDIRKIYEALKKNTGKSMILGYRSEPLMWMDSKYSITKAIIKAANFYKVHLIIHTQSDLGARNDYIDLIKEGQHTVRLNMSLNNGNERVERLLSPGAPSLLRRTRALQTFQAHGVCVYADTQTLPDTEEVRKRLGYAKHTTISSIIKDIETTENNFKKV